MTPVATLRKPTNRRPLPCKEDFYPTGDGKPVGETIYHRDNIFYAIPALQLHFQDRPDVYVSGNDFIYYVEGDPKKRVSPDTYVIKGLPHNRTRLAYLLWEEDNNITPCVVIEFTSKKTWKEDQGFKRELYQEWGVREYFKMDPTLKCLSPPLQGERLVNGVYVPIQPMGQGRLYSEELALYLVSVGQMLKFQRPSTHSTKGLLWTFEEAAALAKQAEVLAVQIEAERQLRLQAQQRAEEAEHHVAQLLAELERLHNALSEKE